MNNYLLLEIGVEELPSRFGQTTLDQIGNNLENLLKEERIKELLSVRVGGKTKNWGCKIGTRCIDTANDLTLFEKVNLKSSILLYPDANGVRSFYSSSGTRVTFNDPSIVNKDMFTSMLGFSEDVWNFDSIDVQNGIYPHIK